MYIEDFCVSRRIGFRGRFLGHQGLSFRQRFLSQEWSMCAEDVKVSRRTGLLRWFLRPRLLVFVNGFGASSSLCTLKISASALNWVSMMIFGTRGTQFSSTVSQSAVVYVHWRFQHQPKNWVSRMIFGTGGTQISLTVCLSVVVYVRRRCQH